MTELIWDGKYQDGKRVAPTRIVLPFQTVETVNESSQQRQRAFDLFSAVDWYTMAVCQSAAKRI